MSANKWHFYTGTILNPKNDTKCEHFVFGMLVVKSNKIHDVLSLKRGLIKYKKHINATNTSNFPNSVIMPGFYDMHFHWVQDDVREMPKDSLLEWLEKHTFPTEMKFSDAKYAIRKAAKFFKRLTSTGTVGGACYSSIHQCALDAAFSKVKGNFVMGNVLMNMNSPAQLTQKEDDAIALTKKLIKKYGKKYCFTPRFAISTTPNVMKQGSQIADKAKCFKQTHLAETPQETDLAISIYRQIPGFEKVSSYTDND